MPSLKLIKVKKSFWTTIDVNSVEVGGEGLERSSEAEEATHLPASVEAKVVAGRLTWWGMYF